jgi:N-acetylmuramoyl-L-alanine amidase
LIWLLCQGAALAQDEKAIYNQIKADYKWLIKNPKAENVYHNWQSLAERFSRVYTANPQGPLAPGSLYWMARIHAGAYKRFKRVENLTEALDICRRLTRHFPKSRLADDAQLRIGSLLEASGKPKKAYLEYLRVVMNYPNGDMKPLAEKRLAALEKILVKGASAQKESPKTQTTSSSDHKSSTLAIVTELRHWSTPTYTRVVMALERPVPYTTHLLKKDPAVGKPRRLYLDLQGSRLGRKVDDEHPIGDGLLTAARAGQYTNDTVRLVLDIKHLASYKVFTLDNPFRVVVDCFGHQKKALASLGEKKKVPRGRAKKAPPSMTLAAALGLGIKRIVIDPGHGGKDPGANWRGLKEKDITLDVAKRLAVQLKRRLGCKVYLTRTTDKFIPLEARTAYANTKDADLFISLHVNAAPSHRLKGVETYFLNLASDEESMRVAARENATTKRSISDLQVILNDLMLNSKINESHHLARDLHRGLLKILRKRYKVRDLRVKQAPFYVLIGARMPAVLVEMGFITNQIEHRRLASKRYRAAVAEGVAKGVVDYAEYLKKYGASPPK